MNSGIQRQDYVTAAFYTHYFIPGSLKLFYYNDVHVVTLHNLLKLLSSYVSTRRWLMKGEQPYPGYCRAPGSNECLPLLCNCRKLKEIWLSSKHTHQKLRQTYKKHVNKT